MKIVYKTIKYIFNDKQRTVQVRAYNYKGKFYTISELAKLAGCAYYVMRSRMYIRKKIIIYF